MQGHLAAHWSCYVQGTEDAGLTVLTMAYAIEPISGCHLNPAVSLGLWIGGRFRGRELPGYLIAQVAGAIIGAGILCVIASGSAVFTPQAGFAANGYADHSPGKYALLACAVTEVVMTFMFPMIIMGANAAGFWGRKAAPEPGHREYPSI